MLEREEKYT